MKHVALLFLVGVTVISCARQERIAALVDTPTGNATYIPGPDSLLPRLVFANGDTSLNDRCMVRLVKLNTRLPAISVNGHPVGFC